MKVLAFAASSSRNSINKQLVTYAAGLLKTGTVENAEIEVIDINDFEMPLYSVDREQEGGIPDLAHQFYNKIGAADVLLISYAEHNGTYTAAYKNLFDWASRIDGKVYQDKPVVLFSSSPGPSGAGSVLAQAKASAPYYGADVKAAFSFSSFYDNFDVENGRVSNAEIKAQLESVLASLN